MSDPAPDTEQQIARLERRVEDLASRLAAVESGMPVLDAGATLPAVDSTTGRASSEVWSSVPALLGRTLVVLGGAFLVRSLTESKILTPAFGVSIGVAYAFVWLLLADRAARRGQTLGGAFHALASALIVYPLLFEAATRLELLAPGTAALLLVAANAFGLAVAWRRDFRSLAWIQQVATLGVAVPLLFRTRSPLAFGLALLALAASSLVLAYGRGWRGQRWLVAIGLDLVFALLLGLRLVGREPPTWLPGALVAGLAIAFTTLYLAAFVLRLLFQGRQVTTFATIQTAAVLLLGFEGALLTGDTTFRRWLAVVALVSGGLLHGVLARRSEARWGHGQALAYFSSVATFLAAEAVRVLLPNWAAAIWLAAAIVLGLLALGGERPVLQIHSALLAAAACLQSGVLSAALAALVAAASGTWRPVPFAAGVLIALAAAVVVVLYLGAPRRDSSWLDTLARVLALGAALIAGGGLLVRSLAATLATAPGPAADAGRLAALRTAVFAVAALALAFAARRSQRHELARLAAALLILGGVKLVLEDLRLAGAGPLVVSLVCYGAALIGVPALSRRSSTAASPIAPPDHSAS